MGKMPHLKKEKEKKKLMTITRKEMGTNKNGKHVNIYVIAYYIKCFKILYR
jgi:hypothetical protein